MRATQLASSGVLHCLNRAIHAELQAISQYTAHAYILENNGYLEMAGQWRVLADEERAHSKLFLARLVLLGGTPDMTQDPVKIAQKIEPIIHNERAGEAKAIADYTGFAQQAEEDDDLATQLLFTNVIADEQEHLNFHEGLLSLISDIGINLFSLRAIGEIKLVKA